MSGRVAHKSVELLPFFRLNENVMISKLCTQMRLEGTRFHASVGRTGMKKRASFEIFLPHICTTVREWEL